MKYAMRYKRKEEGYLLDMKKLIHYAIILYGEEIKRIEKEFVDKINKEGL